MSSTTSTKTTTISAADGGCPTDSVEEAAAAAAKAAAADDDNNDASLAAATTSSLRRTNHANTATATTATATTTTAASMLTVDLRVTGMMCQRSCGSTVRRALVSCFDDDDDDKNDKKNSFTVDDNDDDTAVVVVVVRDAEAVFAEERASVVFECYYSSSCSGGGRDDRRDDNDPSSLSSSSSSSSSSCDAAAVAPAPAPAPAPASVSSVVRERMKCRLTELAVDAVECVGFDAEPIADLTAYLYEHQQRRRRMEQEQTPLSSSDSASSSSTSSSSSSSSSSGQEGRWLLLSSSSTRSKRKQKQKQSLSLPSTKSRSSRTRRNRILLQVGGMSCAVCTGRVERALLSLPAVEKASVVLSTGRAVVEMKERRYGDDDDGDDDAAGVVVVDDDDDDTVPTTLGEVCQQAVIRAGYECDIVDGGDGNGAGAGAPGGDDENKNSSSAAGSSSMPLQDRAAQMERARRRELTTWRRLLCTSFVLTAPLFVLDQQSHRRSAGGVGSFHHQPTGSSGGGGIISSDENDEVGGSSSARVLLLMFLLSSAVQGVVGWRFYKAAWAAWRHGRVMGMDFLVVLGTTSSYVYSVIVTALKNLLDDDDDDHDDASSSSSSDLQPTFATGAMLLTFVTLGKFLESYARGKTAAALQSLMELQPSQADRITNAATAVPDSTLPPQSSSSAEDRDGNDKGYSSSSSRGTSSSTAVDFAALSTVEVSAAETNVGDYLRVLPGARIPADGVLVAVSSSSSSMRSSADVNSDDRGHQQQAYVDESAFSGEPFPVAKSVGDPVLASSVNQLSAVVVRVTAVGDGTVLSQIVQLVEEAAADKAPIQDVADQVAAVFAPAVLGLAAATFTGWMLLNDGRNVGGDGSEHVVLSWRERFFAAFMSAVATVVVACPCALGLATPTAVMVGTGVGARHGLLIKGGSVLEKLSSVSAVVFDKTGTLTTGRAVLKDCVFVMKEEEENDKKKKNMKNDNNENSNNHDNNHIEHGKDCSGGSSIFRGGDNGNDNDNDDSDDNNDPEDYLSSLQPMWDNLPKKIVGSSTSSSSRRQDALLWLACTAECASEHPLARAVCNAAASAWGGGGGASGGGMNDVTFARSDGVRVSDCTVAPGMGAEAVVAKDDWPAGYSVTVRVGSRTWAKEDAAAVDPASASVPPETRQPSQSQSQSQSRGEEEIVDEDFTGDREAMELRASGKIAIYVSVVPTNDTTTATHASGGGGRGGLRRRRRRRRRVVVGVLGIVDPIQPEAVSTVSALQNEMNCDVWMCTGDDAVTARAVATRTGIRHDRVRANARPTDKADLVTALQQQQEDDDTSSPAITTTTTTTMTRRRSSSSSSSSSSNTRRRYHSYHKVGGGSSTGRRRKKNVAVVGDGINDAVALARADVGIAIGAGTSVAVEAADVVLVRSNLHDVVLALHLSKTVYRRIVANFVWAMSYNLLALPFAAGVLYPFTDFKLPPAVAGLMMAFSSVSVVVSSLLLRNYARPVVTEDGTVRNANSGCLARVAAAISKRRRRRRTGTCGSTRNDQEPLYRTVSSNVEDVCGGGKKASDWVDDDGLELV